MMTQDVKHDEDFTSEQLANSVDSLVYDITKNVTEIQTQMNNLLPGIASDITTIISEQTTSRFEIETILGVLLNFGYMGVGESEFKRLNSYYATFNKNSAEQYKRLYEEI